jgi:hypothetical protein
MWTWPWPARWEPLVPKRSPLLEHIERVGVLIDSMTGTDDGTSGQPAYNPISPEYDVGNQT